MTLSLPEPSDLSGPNLAGLAGLRLLWSDDWAAVVALPDRSGFLHVVRFPQGVFRVYRRDAADRLVENHDNVEPADVVAVMRRTAGLEAP